jgi:NAD(P)-dependent dehydrogenase (short-subunit alcohol dehydrogenase family)
MAFFVEMFDKDRNHRCDDKIIVITGANCGIGLETAKEVLVRGARVIILCRNQERMDGALAQLKKISPKVEGIIMDLKSFDSVKTASEALRNTVNHVDILILNAGIMKVPLEICEGLESQQCTNHFSHFLFLNLVFDLVKNAEGKPRVISVSSMAHQMSKNESIYWRKFENEEAYTKEIGIDTMSSWEPYGASKLANFFHMRHAAKLDPKVSFFSLHPGVVKTELARSWQASSPILFTFMGPFMGIFLKTPIQGAQTSIYCALSPELDDEKFNGKYFSDIKLTDPHSRFAYDNNEADKMAEKLWKTSEEITSSTLQ